MIILIGGSSHVGKTLIAQKLLERTHFPYISLDHLKMGFIRSGLTDPTTEDDFKMRNFLWLFADKIMSEAGLSPAGPACGTYESDTEWLSLHLRYLQPAG